MNFLDECLYEADLEYLHQLSVKLQRIINNNATQTRIIQADDILVISAELVRSDNKTRLPMADDFVDRIKSRSQCKPNILGFKHIQSGHYVSVQNFGNINDQRGYAPIYEYFCKANDSYTTISYSTNEVSIKISKLSHFTESRYHSLIDTLTALAIDGLVKHRARKQVTQKRLYNSMRQIVLRRFKIKSYEWGLLFNPTISNSIIPYLPAITQRIEKGTFYLYESPRSDCKIKIYNITAADDRPNQPPSFAYGDRLKFEITYKAEFFDRKKDNLHINSFTYQNIIAIKLLISNKRRLEKHLINKLPPAALRDLYGAANVLGKNEFMKIIDDDHATQVSTDKRIAEIEKRMNAIESLTNEFKYKQGIQEGINAQILAKQTEQDAEIAFLKAAITEQKNLVDKRKLRVVKNE